MNEPICQCGHLFSSHRVFNHTQGPTCLRDECKDRCSGFTDARIAKLESELAKAKRDSERLEWLEAEQGSGLISDDDKHWAVSTFGMQNVPTETPADIWTSFHVEKGEWRISIREAIDVAIEAAAKDVENV